MTTKDSGLLVEYESGAQEIDHHTSKVYRGGNFVGHLVTSCFPGGNNITTVFIPDVVNVEAHTTNHY